MTTARRRVLGVDPGLATTGYGLIDSDGHDARLVASGVIRTRPREPRAERLRLIHDAIRALIAEHGPTELAIEQQFIAENVRSAMAIGEARAAAMIAAAGAGVPVFEFLPAAIKESVTGHGGAPKEQVAQMVMVHLGLSEQPHPLDVSDALAIALTRLADARLEDAVARR
ncbi:MAG: crossover junction endodeoxyribonuclease RuvC [Dehalococcoidia bacterium]